ncbi:SPL family radical SAM protein [Methanobrevibacter filiformis]|uniref:Radical SAM superfamily protein n=1 Tax=Methanobrevibacter filiformis TaxID=55758 RepID=A0A165Z645_9EURY|nr:radical SAM protein [Methanobrevibacter filiformis]KZX10293.1 radical SAM superfamily protein [Methanobrevibacter filiformis]
MDIIFNSINKFDKIADKYSFKTKETRSILNPRKGKRYFFLEDYTLNPYMGCSFDCSYCYVNGSKYANNTENFIVKSNAYEITHTQLKNKVKKGQRGIILIGSASDPYVDIEKELFLTKDILTLAKRFNFPVHIITKSDLILRDIDILKSIQSSAILPNDIEEDPNLKLIISFSFSTIDDKIAEIFEPFAPKPSLRLKAIKQLKKEGFFVGVSLMPILPYITDSEDILDETFSKFKEVEVDYVLYGGLTLYGDTEKDSKIKYYNTIKKHFPEIYHKTKSLFGGNIGPSNLYYTKLSDNIKKIAKKYDISLSIEK